MEESVFSGEAYNSSHSASHWAACASEGMRQSPRGLKAMEPIFTPSGMQLRLNCWVKNRRMKRCRASVTAFGVTLWPKALAASASRFSGDSE